MIFSRGRGRPGRHARADRSGPRHAARPSDADERAAGSSGPDEPDDLLVARSAGPYDISEAPSGVPRLDLGSLQIPAVDGVEVRVQAAQDGTIQQVALVHEESALQLTAVAAPRTEGIWDEVRAELRKSFLSDGVQAEEVAGEYGTELRARVRTAEGLSDLRVLGVNGPRWMVRAVFQGPAALDPAAAGPLADCLDGLVVNRGAEAMPVQEPLPLRLPKEAVAGGPEGSPTVAPTQITTEPGTMAPAGPGGTTAPGDQAAPKRKPSPRSRRTRG